MATTLSTARLRELLHYDAETGVFTRLIAARTWKKKGAVMGRTDKYDGYVRIFLDGKLYKAHRLAWLYVHGDWPHGDLDHIDTVKSNNMIGNLRPANDSQNQQNIKWPRSHGTSGYLGVSKTSTGNAWQARIMVMGKSIDLGRHATPEAAHAVYLTAKTKLHPYQTLVGQP